MGCNTCNDCVLISNDCFSVFAPVKNILLENIMACVSVANLELSNLIGNDCFEELCENKDHIFLSESIFKTWYARTIYTYYIADFGDGQSTKQGIGNHNDDFFAFDVNSDNAIYRRYTMSKDLAESMKASVKDLAIKHGLDCSIEKPCGCRKKCNCCDEDNHNNNYESLNWIGL